MISLDLRHAIGRAVAGAEFGPTVPRSAPSAPDPGLRPGGEPGQYASSVAFGLAAAARLSPERIAGRLAAWLQDYEPWISEATETGRGYVTVTITPEALGSVAGRVIAAGPGCVRSDALAGCVLSQTASGESAAWETAETWEEARERLAAELIGRLAEAAGATFDRARQAQEPHRPKKPLQAQETQQAEEAQQATEAQQIQETKPPGETRETEQGGQARDLARDAAQEPHCRSGGGSGCGGVAVIRSDEKEWGPSATVAYAGRDAVRFSLARLLPGQAADLDREKIARHHLGNPAYAVRYAHARAASGVRWAAADPDLAGPQRPPDYPEAVALLDALSWLPERVATAARRGRPDEFARYLEHLASVTLAALTRPRAANRPNAVNRPRAATGEGPGDDTITLARAARTGLAAGLTLLGVSAPDRLLHNAIRRRSTP